jgi:hypothetical protein
MAGFAPAAIALVVVLFGAAGDLPRRVVLAISGAFAAFAATLIREWLAGRRGRTAMGRALLALLVAVVITGVIFR